MFGIMTMGSDNPFALWIVITETIPFGMRFVLRCSGILNHCVLYCNGASLKIHCAADHKMPKASWLSERFRLEYEVIIPVRTKQQAGYPPLSLHSQKIVVAQV